MKRTSRFFLLALLMLAVTTFIYLLPDNSAKVPEKLSKAQRIEFAFEDNFERTKDPALGYPTWREMPKAVAQTRTLQERYAAQKSNLGQARFLERGPDNIGGRTRSILIDKNDPSGNTIWAGGVGGGLWKLPNANSGMPRWEKVSDYLETLAIGAIAQDPNNPQYIYLGTGEAYSNADAIAGLGMYRSSDGGDTWELLPVTLDNGLITVRAIAVHGETSDVYAGGPGGLFRSSDRGETWEKVLGVGLGAIDDTYDIHYIRKNKSMYASTSNRVYRSASGDARDWEDLRTILNGFPGTLQRIEMSVCEADPNYIYLLGNQEGEASNVYRTTNGGEQWQKLARIGGGDFTNGQAWYDLDIAVDPFNPQHVIAGGVPIFRSLDGGLNWNRFAFNMHVDQHVAVFDKDRQGTVYFGNDGGVWRSTNGSTIQVQNRNLGYNVTQFYACAFHPEAFSNYMLGGTQDNNSLQLNEDGIGSARNVRGGDGMLCHIDQNEPDFQIVSSQFGSYGLSTDGGKTFGGGASSDGSFVNPSDYDNDANILYAQTNTGPDYARWSVPSGSFEFYDIDGIDIGGAISVVIADPTTENRIYLGTFGSRGIYRIDNAHADAQATRISLSNNGTVSCIDIDKDDPNHLLVTLSSFGLENNILESKDGGETWVGVEGGSLPNVPVRWGLFSPKNSEQAVIATEAGIWFTEKLDGDNTTWLPPALGKGSPITRVDMLQIRESDNMLLAATHGRGLFTSDVFADPKVILRLPLIGYIDGEISFDGTTSLGGDSYLWDFGDGGTSTEEQVTHSYDKIGEYEVSLTLNGTETDKTTIKILPNKVLPYEAGEDGYSGSFENRTEDYGVHTISGTAFERGKSTVPGKDGTNSGENVFVTGIEELTYSDNSHSILYLPNYDFSEEGIYEFSFWTKYFIQNGFDGFLVEYSINKGQTWRVLGQEGGDWYDFTNENLEEAAFDIGTPYFSSSTSSWRKYTTDISYLGSKEDVAFRFVFKSESTGNHRGIAIDDVEISKYDGKLETAITSITADYSSSDEVRVEWTTQPEYFAEEFVVERSLNGRDFEVVGNKIDAKGRTSSRVNNYATTIIGARNLYFYRVRSINENQARDYYHEFTSPTVVVRRNIEGKDIFRTFPNPFSTFIDITFNDLVTDNIELQLFDGAGKLIRSEIRPIDDVYIRFETGDLPQGVYFLRYKIGGQESKVVKLMRM